MKPTLLAVADFALITGCSREVTLDSNSYRHYVCHTSMPVADGRTLDQQFSIELRREDMRIALKQSSPGDPSAESYRYLRISKSGIEARNPAGVAASFTAGRYLRLQLQPGTVAISGSCVLL